MRPVEPAPAPADSEVRVVVYRPYGRNASRGYPVYDGDTLIGMAEAGRRFEYRCSPGDRIFHLLGPGEAAVRASLLGGRTYYLRAGERPAWFRMDLILEGLGPETALPEAAEGDLVGLDPAAAAGLRARLDAEAAGRGAYYSATPSAGRTLHSHQGHRAGERPVE